MLRKLSLYFWALLFAFLACFFFSSSTSPLYPHTNIDLINLDSNFFLYEANVWNHGGTPYVDFFDHKGLFHIAIDAIGLRRGGRYGVFSLQILAGFLGLIFLFKAIRLLSPEEKGWIIFGGIAYFAMYTISPCGNTEGEWMLPWVSAGFYYLVKGMKTSSLWDFRLGCFLAGLEVGFSLNSRPLDALWGGTMVVAYFVYYLRKKMGIELLYDALSAILGLALPFVLFLSIAYVGGYASLMLKSVFVEGLFYIREPLDSLDTWLNRGIILIVFILEFFCFRYERKKSDPLIAEFFFVASLVSALLYFVCARFYSYYWSGYTFYILNFIYALSLWTPKKLPAFSLPKKASLVLGSLITVWALTFLTLYYTCGLSNFSASNAQAIETTILNNIPETSRKEKGQVLAIDCDAGVYTVGGIISGEKYFANQSWWSLFMKDVKDSVNKDLLSSTRPSYLLVSENNPWTYDNFGEAIHQNYRSITGTKEASKGLFTIYEKI